MPPQENYTTPQQTGSKGDKETSMEMSAKNNEKTGFKNQAFVSDSEDKNHNFNNRQAAEPSDEDSFEFDDLLPHIGEFGIYQKILFLLMIPFAFFVAWVYFTQIFITITPEQFWCKVPELENLTLQERYENLFQFPDFNFFFSI